MNEATALRALRGAMTVDCTTHRKEYLRLAKVYVEDARYVLESMLDNFWVRPGLLELRRVRTPARQPGRTKLVGWALQDDAVAAGEKDGWSWSIGRALADIGECSARGGYTDARALERLHEHIEELDEAKKLFLKA